MVKPKTRMAAIAILALLVLCLAPPLPVAGIGLGVGPSELEIDNAARGGMYDKTIFVFNGNDEDSIFELGTTEEIAGWVSFHNQQNLEDAISQVNIPAKKTVSLTARFTIPTDAAEPVYQAKLLVRSIPSGQEQTSGNEVLMQMPINVTIKIGGTATIAGTVSAVTAKSSEVGLPLNIAVDFTNGSNIEIAPTIIAQILKGDNQVAQITHSSTRVEPGGNKIITVFWDTSGQAEGTYLVKVEVTLARKTIASQELIVQLQPPGSIPITGEFTGLTYEGFPAVGAITKIIGSFKNSSSVSVRARLIAEIYASDTMVESARTDEVMISEGQEGVLVTYYKPDKPGTYSIKAQVMFGGKSSEFKELTFNVGESSSPAAVSGTAPAGSAAVESRETGSPLDILYPIVGAVVAVAVGVVILVRRRRAL